MPDTKIDEAECMRDSEVMPRESVNKQMQKEIYLEDKTGRAVIKGISGEGYTKYIRDDLHDELIEALKECLGADVGGYVLGITLTEKITKTLKKAKP